MIKTADNIIPNLIETFKLHFLNFQNRCVAYYLQDKPNFLFQKEFLLHYSMSINSNLKRPVGFIRTRSTKVLRNQMLIKNHNQHLDPQYHQIDQQGEEFISYRCPKVYNDQNENCKMLISQGNPQFNNELKNNIQAYTNVTQQARLKNPFNNEILIRMKNVKFDDQKQKKLKETEAKNQGNKIKQLKKPPLPNRYYTKQADRINNLNIHFNQRQMKIQKMRDSQKKSNSSSSEQFRNTMNKIKKWKDLIKNQVQQEKNIKQNNKNYQNLNFSYSKNQSKAENFIDETSRRDYFDEIKFDTKQDGEKLVIKYNPTYFTKQNIPQISMEENLKTQRKQGFQKTKGGICFDLNINEFKVPNKQVHKQTIKSEKKNTKKQSKFDSKKQIIERRNLAKLYDKEARHKIFGNLI